MPLGCTARRSFNLWLAISFVARHQLTWQLCYTPNGGYVRDSALSGERALSSASDGYQMSTAVIMNQPVGVRLFPDALPADDGTSDRSEPWVLPLLPYASPSAPQCAYPLSGRWALTPMLMARSGHSSVRSLARYARVSAEALARHQAEHDPARRR
jgi:hypothetical protein